MAIKFNGVPIETEETNQRVFTPSNIQDILDLKVRKKTIGKYKPMVSQLMYLLNYVYSAQFTRDDQEAPLSTLAMACITNGNTNYFVDLKLVLEENNIIVSDNISRKGIKAYHFHLGSIMENVTWSKSKEVYKFNLPISKRKQEKMKPIPKLTVDETILEKALDYTSGIRGWGVDARQVWEWMLTDNWDNEYIVGTTGRIYGDWSNTPRELRGTFLIDEKECVEVDIKNAQPLFLATLYDEDDSDCKERLKYVSLVERGLLYEHAMVETGCNDRELMKKCFMAFICGKGKKTPLIPEYLQNNFPILYGIIKSQQKSLWKKVAIVLQNIESDIIVNKICEEFPVVSMHDGVICPKDISDQVQSRTKEIIKNELGLNATVKIEDKRKEITEITVNTNGKI